MPRKIGDGAWFRSEPGRTAHYHEKVEGFTAAYRERSPCGNIKIHSAELVKNPTNYERCRSCQKRLDGVAGNAKWGSGEQHG